MPTRFALLLLACLAVLASAPAAPALAQSDQEIGQMRLYIQQLEEQIRRLTGENERLTYQVNQLGGQPGASLPGSAPLGAAPQAGAVLQPPAAAQAGVPADFTQQSIAQNDPLVAPDGAGLEVSGPDGAPIDLSALAGGLDPNLSGQGGAAPVDPLATAPAGDPAAQSAALPSEPPGPLAGSARDEYDAAYGYILTGDYDAAENRFRNWLANFPNDPQAVDAQSWLGESQFQQGKAREAATTFLNLHKNNPQSAKAPDALMKLGMALASLGETAAACATLAEVGLRYPNASTTVVGRVNDEVRRNNC